ncbi:MAG: hypothetical protein MJ232_08685 [archaeon]|nr:hypothetical protein [archaeon]
MENRFVNAFCWLYGTTKKEAVKTYKALKNNDINYINNIINCFENNAKKAFYND